MFCISAINQFIVNYDHKATLSFVVTTVLLSLYITDHADCNIVNLSLQCVNCKFPSGFEMPCLYYYVIKSRVQTSINVHVCIFCILLSARL